MPVLVDYGESVGTPGVDSYFKHNYLFYLTYIGLQVMRQEVEAYGATGFVFVFSFLFFFSFSLYLFNLLQVMRQEVEAYGATGLLYPSST